MDISSSLLQGHPWRRRAGWLSANISKSLNSLPLLETGANDIVIVQCWLLLGGLIFNNGSLKLRNSGIGNRFDGLILHGWLLLLNLNLRSLGNWLLHLRLLDDSLLDLTFEFGVGIGFIVDKKTSVMKQTSHLITLLKA